MAFIPGVLNHLTAKQSNNKARGRAAHPGNHTENDQINPEGVAHLRGIEPGWGSRRAPRLVMPSDEVDSALNELG
jgi:hypothetical protein